MDSIRIKNLKCLTDTGDVSIKAINLLVGANSSGKSTFLRAFPLLKQSTRVGKRGPILWYGEDVDFGSFDIARRRETQSMEFSFSFSKSKSLFIYRHETPISLTFSISPSKKGEYVDQIKILLTENDSIELSFNKDHEATSILINGINALDTVPFKVMSSDSIGLLPELTVTKKYSKNNDSRSVEKHISTIIQDIIQDIVEDPTLDVSNRDYYSLRIGNYLSVEKLKEDLSALAGIERGRVKSITWNESKLLLLKNALTLAELDSLIDTINYYIHYEFGGMSYVKPVRASAERYYRSQNLSVKRLDSDGHNMAMFLNELNKSPLRKEAFQKWTKEFFSFIVETEENAGHISIKIKDGSDDKFDNIADMGFGYSQVLPIIIMMWSSINMASDNSEDREKIIAIEQPELHLHPKLQSRFADALVALIKSTREHGVKVKFIIETHSKVIINRLGLSVAKEVLSKDDISILLFDEKYNSETSVRTSSFTEKGYLQDWPIGFLDA